MHKDWYLYEAIEFFIHSLSEQTTPHEQEGEETDSWLYLFRWVWED